MKSTSVALEDVAERLGLAVSTVSRALRGLPGIHPTTQEKIVEEARNLGYVAPRKRKQEAQAPRNILTLTVGGEVPSLFLSGMSQASLQFNFSLMSHHFSQTECHRLLNPKFQPHLLRMGMVSGIILIYKWPDEIVKNLCGKLPTLSIIVRYPNRAIDMIGIDNVDGMFMLVEHLVASGHRQIGFFGLNAGNTWSRSRFGAYAESMVALGLPIDFENAVETPNADSLEKHPYENENIYKSVIARINRGVHAWVCADDLAGHSLCAALIQRGIKIPEEVAVTGFHRRHLTPSALPELTTTIVKEEVLGFAALDRLAFRLDHPGEAARNILIPPEFYQGQTTLAPAASRDRSH